MGCCNSREAYVAYKYDFPLVIEKRFAIDRERQGAQLQISLQGPRQSAGSVAEVRAGATGRVSMCVLAGYNARLTKEVECKDRAYYADAPPFFAFVLDGHGDKGAKAASECSKFLVEFYKTNLRNFEEHPADTLSRAIDQCHTNLHEYCRALEDSEIRKSTTLHSEWMFTGV